MASTAERARTRSAEEGGGAVADLAPVSADLPQPSSPEGWKPWATLQRVVAQATSHARSVSADDRSEAAAALNAHLREVAFADDREGAAAFLVEQLDAKVWDGLEEPSGWSARATAVEVLLSLGYPHALKVSPEDLEHLRERQARPPGGAPSRSFWLPTAGAALGSAAALSLSRSGGAALLAGGAVLALAVGGACLDVVLRRPRWLGAALMTAAGVLAAAGGLLALDPVTLVVGSAAAVTATLLSMRRTTSK